jgi:hypothetical protein
MKFLVLLLLLALPRISFGQAAFADPKTFSVSSPMLGFSAYTNPTDVCTLSGGTDGTPGFVTRVTRVKISGVATTGSTPAFYLVKRSSLDQGSGASVAMTTLPFDSKKYKAYSTASYWVGTPSLGTLVSQVDAQYVTLQASSGAGSAVPGFIYDYGPTTGLAPIRLYSGEQLAVNFNSATMPSGASLFCQFFWNEGGPQSAP